MLKIWKYFLFSLALVIFVTSCSKEEEEQDHDGPYKTAYKLKEETMVSYHGQMNDTRAVYWYNSKEHVSRQKNFVNGEFSSEYTNYVYDDYGNVLSYDILYNGDQIQTLTFSYDYDSEGRLIKKDDGYGHIFTWQYDEGGRLIYYSYIDDRNREQKNYKYDANDNVTYYELYWDESIVAEIYRTYNSKNLIESEVYEWLDATNRTTWVYNINGTIKEVVYEKWERPDGPFYNYIIHRNFTYDDFGNFLSFEIYEVLFDPDKLERIHTRVFGDVELKD